MTVKKKIIFCLTNFIFFLRISGKRGCSLIRACSLIRSNTVSIKCIMEWTLFDFLIHLRHIFSIHGFSRPRYMSNFIRLASDGGIGIGEM